VPLIQNASAIACAAPRLAASSSLATLPGRLGGDGLGAVAPLDTFIEGSSSAAVIRKLSRPSSASSAKLPFAGAPAAAKPQRPGTAPLKPADLSEGEASPPPARRVNNLSDSEGEFFNPPSDDDYAKAYSLEVTPTTSPQKPKMAAWDDDEDDEEDPQQPSPPPSPPDAGAAPGPALRTSRLAKLGGKKVAKYGASTPTSNANPATPPSKGSLVKPSTPSTPPTPPSPRDRLVAIAWGMAYTVVGLACGASGAMGLYLTRTEAVLALQAWAVACAVCVGVVEPVWIVLLVIVGGLSRALSSCMDRVFARRDAV